MLDNLAGLVLTVSLLSLSFGFPVEFALRYMIPGTAIGVLVGDLLFGVLAFRLARRTSRPDVTAMPLGLDTPSTIGMVLFVVGPAFSGKVSELGEFRAATYAWQIGICGLVLSGAFKMACALAANWIRRSVPRAGLLGSLAAIALVLISFLPLLEILHSPIVGFVSLAVILTTLVARIELPGRVPGALAALVVGTAVHFLLVGLGYGQVSHSTLDPSLGIFPTEWMSAFSFGWLTAFRDSLNYLPVVIPFALGTVVGGIDCTESAAAAGDEYDTRQVVAIEGFATLVAGLCGGIIQTTPFIGHPAYKAMGGRAAYTLATAIFIGTAGVFGYFGYLYEFVITATIYPILVFIGIEITSQSYHATPPRHYPAVALACVPAMAALVINFADGLLAALAKHGEGLEDLSPALGAQLQAIRSLSAGFIVTSLLWSAALANIIDRRLGSAAVYLVVAGLCALFGIIHSPMPGSPLALPWNLGELPPLVQPVSPIRLGIAYGGMALVLVVLRFFISRGRPQELAA
jgi:AGZA family xanthine/uracil permease-like MFS transporter